MNAKERFDKSIRLAFEYKDIELIKILNEQWFEHLKKSKNHQERVKEGRKQYIEQVDKSKKQ